MTQTAEIIYIGNLRTEAVHLLSGNKIITDAPRDNHGKGEAFSPTDLLATSLACCALTTMAIFASRSDIALELKGTRAEVIKVMVSDPRRVAEIHIAITFPHDFNHKEKKMLENTAYTCPVARSLHPDIKQVIAFKYLP